MKSIITTIFVFAISILHCQSFDSYNQSRLDLNKNLMLGLSSWSIANAGLSSIGWATTQGESKYFHQMNVGWSAVNLCLSIPGYLNARKSTPSNISMLDVVNLNRKDEKVFLFNAGLDLAYIAGGFYLKERANYTTKNYHRCRGWGNSIILQGSFLLLFDVTAVVLHSKLRKKALSPLLEKVELGYSGNTVSFRFKL